MWMRFLLFWSFYPDSFISCYCNIGLDYACITVTRNGSGCFLECWPRRHMFDGGNGYRTIDFPLDVLDVAPYCHVHRSETSFSLSFS